MSLQKLQLVNILCCRINNLSFGIEQFMNSVYYKICFYEICLRNLFTKSVYEVARAVSLSPIVTPVRWEWEYLAGQGEVGDWTCKGQRGVPVSFRFPSSAFNMA